MQCWSSRWGRPSSVFRPRSGVIPLCVFFLPSVNGQVQTFFILDNAPIRKHTVHSQQLLREQALSNHNECYPVITPHIFMGFTNYGMLLGIFSLPRDNQQISVVQQLCAWAVESVTPRHKAKICYFATRGTSDKLRIFLDPRFIISKREHLQLTAFTLQRLSKIE